MKENATLGTPLEILAKTGRTNTGSIRHFEKGKTPADDVYCDAVYLCMITSELFRWYTKL